MKLLTKKNLYFSFILFSVSLIFPLLTSAQQLEPVFIHPDSITGKSISLDDVWKYHSGDDSVWVNPDYDDSNWDTLRTRMPSSDTPKELWEGIGWFRTVLKIDSSLRFKSIGFELEQYGASEIYLNGKLITQLGEIGKDAATEFPYHPRDIPFVVLLDSSIIYVLAVRYSNKIAVEDGGWYNAWFNNIGFNIDIREIDDSIIATVNSERTTFAVNIGIAGLFLALALLYLSLFAFYLDRKENLYFALFNFSISIIFIGAMIQRYIQSNLELITIINGTSASFLVLIFPFYLGFLYTIFYKKYPKQFYVFIALALIIIVLIILGLGEDTVSDYALLSFIFIATLEGLRTIIMAIKKDKPNSMIIGAGVIVFALFVVMLFILGIFGISISSVVGILLFFLGLLSLPISMSVYLARDIALTNKDLALQLQNVKELSAKELEQKLRAQKAESENERKTKELEEARQLQLSMLPKELPNLPHLDIAVYMQTATEVGGDYYDFHVDLDGTLTIGIGDATGHGLKAGTMVTTAKSLFNSHAAGQDIIKTFHEFTRVIKNMRMHMMSMCLSILKIKGNGLQMSAAGMPPALLYRKREEKVEELILKGMPLGAFTGFPYKLHETKLQKGDTLFLQSDGLPELFDKDMNMFGYDKVTKVFSEVADRSPAEIIEHLKNSGANWIGGIEPDDDVTFVVIKVK